MNEYKKLNIKDWAVEDRPREKLLSNGSRTLTDAELIAILIGSGNVDETAVELSRRILTATDNNLNNLGRKGIHFLKSFNGIGEAKAVSIVAALELGKRRKEADVFTKNKINGSKNAADYFQPLLGDLNHEEFWVMLLDRGNKILDSFMVSQGGISGTIIDVRLILKTALEKLSSGIILCHNHPSGTMEASDADLKITKKIIDAAKIMDISVLDHIIIGQNSYLSLADEGML
ncbi:MAG: DNA repair protein RadC [Prolixibacteraceae bacterium]|jgi:DNA repair protein RadC|nr:DNA repair protein RadC [Prolixibacteraceae bacterium]MBT6004892.1 DNA repair protein RadC [Prolixibacteraceae bacterium]MBT6764515.1 DNA repair protein RadC [Prolixibacteraceae bacterium]MBT7397532.1 DNA repair protein RadC [Prolixibacteraceae bacterium]